MKRTRSVRAARTALTLDAQRLRTLPAHRLRLSSPALALLLLLGSLSRAGDWPQFRGPGGSAVADEPGLPIHWDGMHNLRWKVDLPGRGVSSPVVAAGRVYVTACTGYRQDRLHLFCFDAADGRELWHRQFAATGNTLCHPKTCTAAPTPVTDGERVYALFATGDLAGLDAAGNLLWYRALARDYPHITNQVGMAASPLLCGDVLIVPLENADASFAAGLDRWTGQNRWKVDRPREINWVTPQLLDGADGPEVLFASPDELTAYDPATGQQRWRLTRPGLCPVPSVPSPAVGEGLIVLANGIALRLGAAGKPPTVAWQASKLRPAYASPLVYRGRIYAVSNTAVVLNCFALRTGKIIWQKRVRGPFSASPVAGDGKIYLVNEEGTVTVFAAGDQPRVLGVNKLDDPILATPALADGAIFLRSDRHLYCFAEGKEARR